MIITNNVKNLTWGDVKWARLWLLESKPLKPSDDANETIECPSFPFVVAKFLLARNVYKNH